MRFVWLSVLLVCVGADCEWQFGNSCYQLLMATMKFDEGLQACSAMGARVVVPGSKNENQYIWEMMKNHHLSDGRVWIGCTDEHEEGMWMYADDPGTKCKILSWAQGEPNNQEGDEHCTQMWGSKDGKWVDIECSVTASVICEYNSTPELTCLQADADGHFA